MQPTEVPNHIHSGPDEQMVRVPEDNLCTTLVKLARAHRLYRPLRTNRHKSRCFDHAVCGVKTSPPR